MNTRIFDKMFWLWCHMRRKLVMKLVAACQPILSTVKTACDYYATLQTIFSSQQSFFGSALHSINSSSNTASHPGLPCPTGPKGSNRAPGGTAPGGSTPGIPPDGSKPERG